MADVVVIGCGVIGLSTAVLIRENGLDARIVAAAPPEETTSAVAAAIWYPYRAYPEGDVLRWGGRTFEVFEELAALPETGVRMREGIELRRSRAPEPWWSAAVPGVRRCGSEELPSGYHDGHAFVVPVVEMPVYLRYLQERFAASGGTVERRMVADPDDLAEESGLVVNCTGLGARELVGDGSMTPVRGQVLRVRNPGLDRFFLDEDDPEGVTYVVPRSRDCILGGTADEGTWNLEPNPDTAAAILRRCSVLEPRLADAEVLEHRVGLRPGRPEVRLEREDGRGVPVIHNYGHGGSGITLSWGCAEEVVALVGNTPREPG
ncbi:MAG: D-amino-acid oxidase [uncultured Rubrobacteraceae bacterium]|uniref:D-amino-acid oxidase n=1 Tax=uncultured Rubrobacteraceae bacterium TaxID=349277 RepID=A0A6J4NZB2_9ACTN|nr:MAG: D-amino-acid oxidase [uncultured Rubrobacteraceae bacterium]